MQNVEDEIEDAEEESDQFTMLAERRTPGPSVEESNRKELLAAENNKNNENENVEMIDIITVECQKLNGKPFIGTVNFNETKIKIFKDGLGLDVGLLGTVKITFKKCPVVTFKLKSKINIKSSIKNSHFEFTFTPREY